MRKVLKISAIILVAGFFLIQIYRPARTNFPIIESETLEATTQIPENVRAILKRSCNDCHTNQTNWIWYSNIAPISWGMVDHVNEGREELNFSKWATYDANLKDKKLDEICIEVENAEMPHYQYLWLNRDAGLSADEIKILCDWTKSEQAKLTENSEENKPQN